MARAKPGWDPAMAYRYRNTWDEQEDSFSAGGGGSSASSGYATGTYEGAWEDGTQDPGPEEEAAGSEQGQPEPNRRALAISVCTPAHSGSPVHVPWPVAAVGHAPCAMCHVP